MKISPIYRYRSIVVKKLFGIHSKNPQQLLIKVQNDIYEQHYENKKIQYSQ